jgi:hypothetical protein
VTHVRAQGIQKYGWIIFLEEDIISPEREEYEYLVGEDWD